MKLFGEQNRETLSVALNYAVSLGDSRRFEEAKPLLRRTMPMARRVFGASDQIMLKMRWYYAEALYVDPGATLDDIREAVTTLEDLARTAQRVLGAAHPVTKGMEDEFQKARAALRARESS